MLVGLGRCTHRSLEVESERRELLSEAVVELARDARALFILDREHALAQLPDLKHRFIHTLLQPEVGLSKILPCLDEVAGGFLDGVGLAPHDTHREVIEGKAREQAEDRAEQADEQMS